MLKAIRKAARDMSGGWAGKAKALEAAFFAAAADMGHPAVSKHVESMAKAEGGEVEPKEEVAVVAAASGSAPTADEQMHSA